MLDAFSFRMLLAVLVGWIDQRQQDAVAYLTAGADFFTTEVWTWRGLVTYYTVFAIDLASRRVHVLGSTFPPE